MQLFRSEQAPREPAVTTLAADKQVSPGCRPMLLGLELATRMASRTQAEGQMLLGRGLGLLGTVLLITCLVNLRKLRQ
jgi:hypothetical protein